MLEEVLKSINSNLERIANSLAKNAKEVTESTKKIVIAGENVIPPQPIVHQAPVTEMPQPMQPTIPQQTIPQTIPITQVQENFTQEQLAVAMSNAVSAGKISVIQGILQQFGVQALTQINSSEYNKLASMLKEAGVEV